VVSRARPSARSTSHSTSTRASGSLRPRVNASSSTMCAHNGLPCIPAPPTKHPVPAAIPRRRTHQRSRIIRREGRDYNEGSDGRQQQIEMENGECRMENETPFIVHSAFSILHSRSAHVALTLIHKVDNLRGLVPTIAQI